MRDDGRRARIVAAVTDRDSTMGVAELMRQLCLFAVDRMALSGCALVLMSGNDESSVLASAGPHARTVTTLQMELGEGPCLDAYTSRVPVLLPDLSAKNADRWPAFAAGRPGGRGACRILPAAQCRAERYWNARPLP